VTKTTKSSKTIRANTQGQTEGEASAPESAGDWIAYPALHDDRLVKWGADSDIGISSGLERTLSLRV
jgi:hypothetical protein